MDANKIQELIAKYNEGLADPAEVKALEKLIEEGGVELTQLNSLAALDEQIMHIEGPLPSLQLDSKFHEMLSAEKKKLKGWQIQLPSMQIWMPRLAFGLLFLAVGFYGGTYLQKPEASDVQVLTQQVGELKEMMVLSLLEKESASERIRAVSLTSEMDQVSDKVTDALFQTLNNDPNINVRLATLDALIPYVKQSNVREQLVRSISKQDSPLVQIALADLMASIQEKKSVSELQKVLDNDRTPVDVKKRIRKSMEKLI